MSKLATILALAMGERVSSDLRVDPWVCFADDYVGEGYATVGEMGSFNANGQWVPADYSTMGASGPGMLMRPGAPGAAAARPAASPMRLSPQMLRPMAPIQQVRPLAAAPQQQAYGGVTEAQARQIAANEAAARAMTEAHVQDIVRAMLAQMTPYGQIPSRVAPDEALFPMGLGYVILTGGPPATLSGFFNNGGQGILPQRAFRGERLVLSTFRSNGAASVPVIVDTFKVGDYSQLVGGGAVPVETFSPDSFGVRLMLDGAVPGVTYTLGVSVPAAVGIPAGETITIVGAVIGRAGEAANR